jgi:hypothetical protein
MSSATRLFAVAPSRQSSDHIVNIRVITRAGSTPVTHADRFTFVKPAPLELKTVARPEHLDRRSRVCAALVRCHRECRVEVDFRGSFRGQVVVAQSSRGCLGEGRDQSAPGAPLVPNVRLVRCDRE